MENPETHLSEKDQILLEVGRALKQWYGVERNLAAAFGFITAGDATIGDAADWKRMYGGIAVFNSLNSFRAQMKAFKAAVKHSPFADAFVQEHWPTLGKQLNGQYDLRNELSHFDIIQTGTGTLLQPFAKAQHWEFMGEKHPARTLTDIKDRRSTFGSWQNRTMALIRYIENEIEGWSTDAPLYAPPDYLQNVILGRNPGMGD